MGLLTALIMLVVQAMTTVTSAKESVAGKVELLLNTTEEIALSTRASVNSLRGASRNAELFSVSPFAHLANATQHVDEMTAFVGESLHKPISLNLVGR